MQRGLIVGQIVADYGLQVFFFPLSGNIHFHLVEDFVCNVALYRYCGVYVLHFVDQH